MRQRRKVEILGCGWSFGIIPPFDPAAERWGMNALMAQRFAWQWDGWSRWFDLHDDAHVQKVRPEMLTWYRQQTKPIYRWHDDGPMVRYPLERILARFGVREFWGSLSYMLALAIDEGFEAIDLFWFTMQDPEHAKQLPCAKYWIGLARGMGIPVTIHGDSALTYTGPLYGVDAV